MDSADLIPSRRIFSFIRTGFCRFRAELGALLLEIDGEHARAAESAGARGRSILRPPATALSGPKRASELGPARRAWFCTSRFVRADVLDSEYVSTNFSVLVVWMSMA